MKAYIDIGNTVTSIYIDMIKFELITIKNHELVDNILEYLLDKSITDIFIVSVVPEVEVYFGKLSEKYDVLHYNLEYFNYALKFGQTNYSQMGADRVVVDSFGISKYGDNCIIVDLGTAITVDVICNSTYVSGYIYPGLETSKVALIGKASKLSSIEYKSLNSLNRCLDSESQINDGLVIGMLGAMNALIGKASLCFEVEDYNIIITGGYFNLLNEILSENEIRHFLGCSYIYDRNLMYDGMRYLDDLLRGKNETRKH